MTATVTTAARVTPTFKAVFALALAAVDATAEAWTPDQLASAHGLRVDAIRALEAQAGTIFLELATLSEAAKWAFDDAHAASIREARYAAQTNLDITGNLVDALASI